MATNNQNSRAAREAAAAAKAQAKAQQKARDRKVTLIGIGVVVAVVAILGVLGVVSVNKHNQALTGPLPTGVTSDTYGVKVGPAWKAANADSIPKLQLWEDFQCPACGGLEKNSGATILNLAETGKVRLEWRPTTFLDQNLTQQNNAAGNPLSSLNATMAFGCAIDAGKAQAFHSIVFAHQPKEEGAGYSATEMTAAAQAVGITGSALKTFNSCLATSKYKNWANDSFAKFNEAGVTQTPTGILNGKEMQQATLYDPNALKKAIADATK